MINRSSHSDTLIWTKQEGQHSSRIRMKTWKDLNKDKRYQKREIKKWDDDYSMFCTGSLDIDMNGTKTFSHDDLGNLGVQEWVAAISTIATRSYTFFPDLTH